MTCLAAVAYDPSTAVSKATTAALALTALDTTNLRLTFNAPASGRVWVDLSATLHGATTFPQVLLGVLGNIAGGSGTSVLGRVSPEGLLNGTGVATTFLTVRAWFPISGLSAGTSYSLDAAYGVETAVASTGLKYGGPNDATANNAWGACVFSVWDL